MKRKTMLLLDHPTEEDHEEKLTKIREFVSETGCPCSFGFSANVGEHGGFITENQDVWNAWTGGLAFVAPVV